MSNQMITSTLLVDLSTEEQQFLAGGFGYSSCSGGKEYGGKKYGGKDTYTDKSSGCDCGASMYVGHKIKVTPYSKCVGGETGGCS
ncbi:hypothetical protein VB735_09530 [Halotia wernerae UHCC 0503]|nr:hypothetical protein [Halotia wernerae UHCC 0503]